MIERLVEVVGAHAVGVPQPLTPAMAALAATAPAEVAALIELLGTRNVRVGLGWRGIQSRYLTRLHDTWRTVVDDTDAIDPREAELASGVQIGASAGGEVYFGLCWGASELCVAEIDVEEAFIRWFDSFDDFLEHVKESEEGQGDMLSPGLLELLPALSRPLAPVAAAPDATPAVQVWRGTPPPHPHAHAQAHFQQAKGVLQAGPTASGRTVLVRRFAAGNPHTRAAIAVREPDGSVRALPWTDTEDIYGVCLVPGEEFALVCTGAPGPLLEIDLETGDQEQRLAYARWSCGFVDDDHVVVHEDGEARVYAYSVGMAPVASAVVEGMNLYVGQGRVFTLPSGPSGTLQVHRWDGAALVPELRAPMTPRVFFCSAAAEQDGHRLVGSVDFQGKATWFDTGPV